MVTRIVLAFCLTASLVSIWPFFFSARAETVANNTKKKEHYDWQGAIGGKIPVSVWLETRDGLIAGEIVYTKTKEKKPIRLLGTASQEYLYMKEMVNGLVTGFIAGTVKDGVFEGIWRMPDKIKEKNGDYEFIDGKELSIRLVAAPNQSGSFRWEYDPDALAGQYVYSYGNNAAGGAVDVARAKDGSIEFSIGSHIGAPSFNMVDVPAIEPDAKEPGKIKGRLLGNRILHEMDADCAFEILFFNDFLVIRYLEGRTCNGWFGRGAGIEGQFMRQGKQP